MRPSVIRSTKRLLSGRYNYIEEYLDDLKRDREDACAPLMDTALVRFENPAAIDRVKFTSDTLKVRTKHFFLSPTYMVQCRQADWTNVKDDVRAFAALYCNKMRKELIPLYVHTAWDPLGAGALADGSGVVIRHSVHGAALSPREVRFLTKAAQDLIEKMKVKIQVGPHGFFQRQGWWDEEPRTLHHPTTPEGERLFRHETPMSIARQVGQKYA